MNKSTEYRKKCIYKSKMILMNHAFHSPRKTSIFRLQTRREYWIHFGFCPGWSYFLLLSRVHEYWLEFKLDLGNRWIRFFMPSNMRSKNVFWVGIFKPQIFFQVGDLSSAPLSCRPIAIYKRANMLSCF